MPTNLYGPNDNFDSTHPMSFPLIAKMARAKDEGRTEVELWGTGTHAASSCMSMIARMRWFT